MTEITLEQLTELEQEFMQEGRGEGSLSPYIAQDAENFSRGTLRENEEYAGFDINPEDIEALYFEGLKLPRWESLPAEKTLEEKQAMYYESLEKNKSDYPLISRVNDTDRKVVYTPEEVLQLKQECETVLENADHAKAVRALQKFIIVCNKAAAGQMWVVLSPSY